MKRRQTPDSSAQAADRPRPSARRRRCRRVVCAVVALLLLGLAGTAAAADRVALVIGNDDYRGWPPLASAVNDAEAVALRLRALGFELVGDRVWTDLDLQQMRAARDALHEAAAGADTAMVFFAGHGSGEQNNNWLVPVDAESIGYREDLPGRALSLNDFLRGLPRHALKIVMLDACRDFGLPSRRGADAEFTGFHWVDMPDNTVLALSASIGQQAHEAGGHGLYTRTLLEVLDRELEDPERRILDILNAVSRNLQRRTQLNQRPEVYFNALAERVTEGEPFALLPDGSEPAARGLDPALADSSATMPDESSGQPRALCPAEPAWSAERDCPQCPELAALPALRFPVGTNVAPDADGSADFSPERERMFSAIAVGRHPVTHAEWQACADAGPCRRLAFSEDEADHPVTGIDWSQARTYVEWLSEHTGETYRLPSEAEWEYAARGGQHRERVYWQSRRTARACDYAHTVAAARACDLDRPAETIAVGSLEPNCFGLHDVLGNVWEWTSDCVEGTEDAAACNLRIARGGGWGTRPADLRLTRRAVLHPGRGHDMLGFRVLRERSGSPEASVDATD